MEQVVCFSNKQGNKLYGIAHVPECALQNDMRIGINLLNPGIKYRVAPNRLNVKIARMLCNAGYYVLRFDPAGIGDSEGELPSGEAINNIWGSIQKGVFVEDVQEATRVFCREYNLDKLFLIGNCGGAITALLSADRQPKPDGLVLIDMPISVDGEVNGSAYADNISAGGAYAKQAFWGYCGHVIAPRSLWRLVTFKSDYRAIAMAIKGILSRQKRKPATACAISRLNGEAVKALTAYLAGGEQALFVLAGNDPNSAVLQHQFFPWYQEEHPEAMRNLTIEVIEHANHVYAWAEWQDKLLGIVQAWMRERN